MLIEFLERTLASFSSRVTFFLIFIKTNLTCCARKCNFHAMAYGRMTFVTLQENVFLMDVAL